ncbi:MAG: RluA family pseudouridine synthase [Clostridia bacterium]|nr:RluA family pseudouridine synthase [Clostridia bacterium]
MREIKISRNDAGQRLDKFLHKLMPSIPDSMLYKGLRKECVRLNGKHTKDASVKLLEGDILKLYYSDEFFEKKTDDSYKKLTPKLTIVYEDENLLLTDKPQGLCVHEDESGEGATLIDYIKCYLWKKGEYCPEEEQSFVPALCNRIDRNTRGIVIAAKNAEALRIMNEKIKEREIEKYYICAVDGIMSKKSGELRAFLRRDEKKKQVYIYNKPVPDGKTIITAYKVIAEGAGRSLLEVELKTGRTHQIRAHFASIGHPLIGDGKYGKNEINKEAGIFRQALCSHRLKFNFKTDAGILEYLNGREFSIGEIPFYDLLKK